MVKENLLVRVLRHSFSRHGDDNRIEFLKATYHAVKKDKVLAAPAYELALVAMKWGFWAVQDEGLLLAEAVLDQDSSLLDTRLLDLVDPLQGSANLSGCSSYRFKDLLYKIKEIESSNQTFPEEAAFYPEEDLLIKIYEANDAKDYRYTFLTSVAYAAEGLRNAKRKEGEVAEDRALNRAALNLANASFDDSDDWVGFRGLRILGCSAIKFAPELASTEQRAKLKSFIDAEDTGVESKKYEGATKFLERVERTLFVERPVYQVLKSSVPRVCLG